MLPMCDRGGGLTMIRPNEAAPPHIAVSLFEAAAGEEPAVRHSACLSSRGARGCG